MQVQISGGCPACGHEMEITRYRCTRCGTEVSGHFTSSRLAQLDENLQEFIITFIVKRGNIKLVEKALGISYPTVRKMLQRVIEALGYEPEPSPRLSSREKLEILNRLERGEIDYSTAMTLLEGGAAEREG